MHQFGLEGGPEAFRSRVDPALSAVAHAGLGLVALLQVHVVLAGTLPPGNCAEGMSCGLQRADVGHNCIKAFTDWAVRSRRVEHDPLAALERTERKDITFKHRRRALTVEQVAKLLDATERRPLHELLVIRRGKDKGKLSANVRPRILERAKRTGAERRLTYLLAVWTGLRRSELGALRWSDVVLDAEPAHIRLRAETTKSKRADRVILHQEIADELRRIKLAKLAPTATVLSSVPGMRVLVSNLRFAGIDPGSEADGFIDLHALRKTLSTMMAVAGLNQRVRQATKSRRADCVPLHSSLVTRMEARRHRSPDVSDASAVFPDIPDIHQHRACLEAAGVRYVDSDGKVGDFHALRHTFVTRLLRAGVSPWVAQELARHTDLKLTTSRYADPRLFDTAAAVELLVLPDARDSRNNVLSRTGTDPDTLPIPNSMGSAMGSAHSPSSAFVDIMRHGSEANVTRRPSPESPVKVEEKSLCDSQRQRPASLWVVPGVRAENGS